MGYLHSFQVLSYKIFIIKRERLTLQGRGLEHTELIKQSMFTWSVMGQIEILSPPHVTH